MAWFDKTLRLDPNIHVLSLVLTYLFQKWNGLGSQICILPSPYIHTKTHTTLIQYKHIHINLLFTTAILQKRS